MGITLADGGRVVVTLEFDPPAEADDIAEELREIAERVEQAEQVREGRSELLEYHSRPSE